MRKDWKSELNLEINIMSEPNSSKIGLLDNACHSLQRGYEMFNKGKNKKDALALKEAIIWIHHGIELSIKQLLVQSNEYLIFENIDEAVRKLAHLRKQPNMDNANVLDLFDSSEGVYTVGFGKLVDRAAIMLNIQELSQGAELREKIDALTSYRNKTVHFTVDVRLEEVINLLGELMEPFLSLLSKEINNKDFVKGCIPKVRAQAESVSAVYRLQYKETEERIEKLLLKFNGIEVSGDYFRIPGRIRLPKFDSIEKESKPRDFGFDLFAKSNTENWAIEIKIGRPNSNQIHYLMEKYKSYLDQFSDVKFWLIVLGTESVYSRLILQNKPAMVSSEKEIQQLEKLLKV
jgi:hypothetical protein